MDDSEFENWGLLSLWRGAFDGGAVGNALFIPIIDYCRDFWDRELASNHFNDWEGLDVLTLFGDEVAPPPTEWKGKFGVMKFYSASRPRRYMVDIYIPSTVWKGRDAKDPHLKNFYLDCLSDALNMGLDHAEKKSGRLKDRAKTRATFDKFAADVRAREFGFDQESYDDHMETDVFLSEIVKEIAEEES